MPEASCVLALTDDNQGCQAGDVKRSNPSDDALIARIKEVRARAIEHTRQARRCHDERRGLMQQLIDAGWSQADIARELGVTRQAVQKMMSL